MTSAVPRSASSASVASTGPEVITGEAIRTRSRAAPIAVAIRCESCSPWPGVNQGCTSASPTRVRRGAVWPLRSTSPCDHSSAKLAR